MSPLPVDSQITFLYTKNLEKSARFYEDILELPLAVKQGSCRIYHIVGKKAYFGICERDTAPDNPVGIIFTFVTQDVDGWYEKITSKGWDCEKPPESSDTYKLYHFFVADPNGYKIESDNFDLSSCLHASSDAVDGCQRCIQQITIFQ